MPRTPKQIDPRTKPVYMVWSADVDTDGGEYWLTYDSLGEAVSEHGPNVDVYRSQPKKLGKFKQKLTLVKVKPRKKKVSA